MLAKRGERGKEGETAEGEGQDFPRAPAIRNHPAGNLQQRVPDQKGGKDQAETGLVPPRLAHDNRRGHRDVDPIDVIDHRAAEQ